MAISSSIFFSIIHFEDFIGYLDKLSDSNERNFNKYKIEIFQVDKTKIRLTKK